MWLCKECGTGMVYEKLSETQMYYTIDKDGNLGDRLYLKDNKYDDLYYCQKCNQYHEANLEVLQNEAIFDLDSEFVTGNILDYEIIFSYLNDKKQHTKTILDTDYIEHIVRRDKTECYYVRQLFTLEQDGNKWSLFYANTDVDYPVLRTNFKYECRCDISYEPVYVEFRKRVIKF